MKVLVFSLALLLILTCGEALECSHCVPRKPGGTCTTTVEKCEFGKDACARAKFLISPYSHFQRCISMHDCHLLQTNAFINLHCCDTDRCNA
ncbi:phospholipase A2 inhibitor and Ly6/PLAUR domain-containing protein-like [Conger conger]|uniref:phospholipase A2 inhibitor and Ly6/PLAUR domain-containing protein-like n=1 Tax=Conger conger TaxID=82655 RepID=UPI002A59C0FD|nr:phospholipase A2 inhibitor and Ly6/PLAUR domain-containing protein-like [Conger conger]